MALNMYSKTATEELFLVNSFPGCLVGFNNLIAKEGYNGIPVFHNNEKVIDMDYVEEQISIDEGRERNRSMDSAFCLESNVIPKVVLVEYKFNINDFKYLNLAEMVGKVSGSTAAINEKAEIFYNYYFVFKADILAQAVRRMYNMNPKPNNRYVAINIHYLKELFFR